MGRHRRKCVICPTTPHASYAKVVYTNQVQADPSGMSFAGMDPKKAGIVHFTQNHRHTHTHSNAL